MAHLIDEKPDSTVPDLQGDKVFVGRRTSAVEEDALGRLGLDLDMYVYK